MITMLGIPNCDTVRKARKFLREYQVEYEFRDLRKKPLSAANWQDLLGQDEENKLLNTKSSSFRQFGVKASELDQAKKLEMLQAKPTLMKRPTLLKDGQLFAIGFSEALYQQYFG